MEKKQAKLKNAVRGVGPLVLFVVLIVGIPLVLLLPTANVEYPAWLHVPPFIGRILTSIFYGCLTLVGLAFGGVISYVISSSIYHRVRRIPLPEGRKHPPMFALVWWTWGAIMCWIFVFICTRHLVRIWITTS